jgi:hypothetical protein
MEFKQKVLAFAAVIAVFFASTAFAQSHYKDTPFDGPESNQIQATAGVFDADVDNYLDVNYWSSVEFGKWFGFITGGFYDAEGYGFTPFAIDLGYATKFGKIYLGTRYVGNIMQTTGDGGPAVSTEEIEVDYPALPYSIPDETRTTTTYSQGWYNSTNQIDIVVGFGNMGISAGFFESITTNKFDAPDGTTTTKTVTHETGETVYTNQVIEYVDTRGHLFPSLGFGMNLNIGKMALKPYVGLGLDIFKDRLIENRRGVDPTYTYTVYDNGITTLGGEEVSYSGENNGYMIPSITIGATLELPAKDTSSMTVSLEYGLGIGIYSNDYDAGVSGTAKGDVSYSGERTVTRYIDRTVTRYTSEIDFIDKSYFSHAITPSFVTTKDMNDLKLGFKAELPINMTFTTEDRYRETYNTTKTEYDWAIYLQDNSTTTTKAISGYRGGDTSYSEISEYNVAPVLGVGASYQLFPKRFAINAGVKAVPFNFNRKIIRTMPGKEERQFETVVDGYGKKTTDTVTGPGATTRTDRVVVEDTINSFYGNVTGGFVFSFNDNLALDMLAGVALGNYSRIYDDMGDPNGSTSGASSGTNGFNINITTVKLLFTFKF